MPPATVQDVTGTAPRTFLSLSRKLAVTKVQTTVVPVNRVDTQDSDYRTTDSSSQPSTDVVIFDSDKH